MRKFINIVENALSEASRETPAQRFIQRSGGLWDPRLVRIDLCPEDYLDVSIQKLSVDAQYRGEGLVSDALKALGKLADRMGVTLYLEALPDESDDDMDQDQGRLIAFYRRNGFEGGETDGMMWREPKSKTKRKILPEEGLIIPGVNTTQDVKPGETKRQGSKFGFELSFNGVPPILNTNGKSSKSLKTRSNR